MSKQKCTCAKMRVGGFYGYDLTRTNPDCPVHGQPIQTECECSCWTCRMVGDLKHCRSEDCTPQKTEGTKHIRHCIKCDFCIEHNEHCFEDNPALEEKRKAYIQGIRGLKNKKLPVGERYIKLDDALAVVNSNNLK